MNNPSSRLVKSKSPQIAEIKNGLGNNFILPVIPVQGFQQQFWEQLKFTLNSCIRA
jgi:hypothetical protein